MKTYRATITINVFCRAESEDVAKEIFQEMDYSFIDLEEGLLDTDIIDLEVSETEE